METKDWIGIVLTIWTNIIATIALIHSIKKDKKKTAKRVKPHKQTRKR